MARGGGARAAAAIKNAKKLAAKRAVARKKRGPAPTRLVCGGMLKIVVLCCRARGNSEAQGGQVQEEAESLTGEPPIPPAACRWSHTLASTILGRAEYLGGGRLQIPQVRLCPHSSRRSFDGAHFAESLHGTVGTATWCASPTRASKTSCRHSPRKASRTAACCAR